VKKNINRKVKRKVRKVKRRVKKEGKHRALVWVYGWIYFIGLTSLIPFILFNAAPTELGIWSGAQEVILTLAILFILGGVYGMGKIHKKKSEAAQALALTTLIPGVISLIVSVLGRPLVNSLVHLLVSDLSNVERLIILYINRVLPQVWFLTFAYISIGGIMYMISKSMSNKKRH